MKTYNTENERLEFLATYYNLRDAKSMIQTSEFRPLKLIPLHKISSGDIYSILRMENENTNIIHIERFDDCLKVHFWNTDQPFFIFHHANEPENLTLRYADIFRSMGYAVPWRGLSVETLVEYGWIELL